MSNQQSATPNPWQKISGEPTLHFFLIAVAIFAFYSYQQSRQDNVLEVSQREIDARVFMLEMSRGEPLTDEQRDLIALAVVEEQVLVREAIKLGLDNDARISDMLAQKMRHVLSGNIVQPSSADLESFYAQNAERYRSLATVSADELVFNSTNTLSEGLLDQLSLGAEPQQLLALQPGSSSFLPQVNNIDLGNIFSSEYSEQVFAADVNEWVGPYVSNRGQHWLRIQSKQESRLPSLNEVSDRLRLDWISSEEDRLLQQEIDSLLRQYAIVITDDTDAE